MLSVKKRKQQWKFRFVVWFLEKPQIFKCGAEIRLWNGLSLCNFMKWHKVVCFFKNWRVVLTLFEIHICALCVLVWLEIIMLLAPSGGKSVCICHSFIVSFLQQLWHFLWVCCSVFFAYATVTKRCQRTTLIMDWEGYLSQADVVSQVVFITFLFCSSLCCLFVGTLLVKGCCRKCCCCLVRDATEEVPRNAGLGIFTAKYTYIYVFAGDGILILSESTETE